MLRDLNTLASLWPHGSKGIQSKFSGTICFPLSHTIGKFSISGQCVISVTNLGR